MIKTKNGFAAIWSTGLAMFAMFFGAGNIVFPLAMGQMTQDKNIYAVIGMIITAVVVPLAGVLAMMLYNGDYTAFFKRIGKFPGFLMVLLILGLIGPFGGIPRCITISHSTLSQFGLPIDLITFSLVSCALVFLFTYRPSKILSLLGYVLTPILLGSLGFIIFKGLFSQNEMGMTTFTRWETFSQGLIGGYNTMDLLAAFFFSTVVLVCLRGKGEKKEESKETSSALLRTAVFSSLVAAVLLALVYVSFSFLAAHQSSILNSYANHEILGALANHFLGHYAGLVAGLAVAFACLTTEIALAAIIAEFLRKTIFKEKIRYELALGITLLTSFAVSTLHFEGISTFIVPILQIFYPALIVLTILNILYKLYDFKPVKWIFYGTFLVSLVAYFI